MIIITVYIYDIICLLYYARHMRPHSLTAQSAGKTFVATFILIIIIIGIAIVIIIIIVVVIIIVLFSSIRLPVES